ncbi:MAG: GFA family protein [Euryarchaeota archaeon]|nr:GFA family protein [Euryarchaeota archaeon]
MIEGGCLCKSIRYAAEGPFFDAANCHCTECRASSGAPFLSFFSVARDRFRFTKGKPREYRSSPVDVRSFCPDCGTQLTFWTSRAADTIDVTMGSLDDPGAVVAEADIWLRSKVPWVVRDERLPAHEKART